MSYLITAGHSISSHYWAEFPAVVLIHFSVFNRASKRTQLFFLMVINFKDSPRRNALCWEFPSLPRRCPRFCIRGCFVLKLIKAINRRCQDTGRKTLVFDNASHEDKPPIGSRAHRECHCSISGLYHNLLQFIPRSPNKYCVKPVLFRVIFTSCAGWTA